MGRGKISFLDTDVLRSDGLYRGLVRSEPGLPTGVISIAKGEALMIRKLKSGEYRLYSRKLDPKTHKRKNLGTFKTHEAAEKHEREVQYFKHH